MFALLHIIKTQSVNAGIREEARRAALGAAAARRTGWEHISRRAAFPLITFRGVLFFYFSMMELLRLLLFF